MAGLVPAIHVLHHPRMSGGYVYILASAPNGILYVGVTNDLVRRIYEHRPDRGIYEAVFCQAARLLRALRRYSGGDTTRTQHQALVAKMESEIDTGQQSELERAIRFDHLRTWMAGTSPAMTTGSNLTQSSGPGCRERFLSVSPDRRPACARRSGAWSDRPCRTRSPGNSWR